MIFKVMIRIRVDGFCSFVKIGNAGCKLNLGPSAEVGHVTFISLLVFVNEPRE